MSVNRHRPHLIVIPEDDANRQILNGFLLHPEVVIRNVQDMRAAGGWPKVLDNFRDQVLPTIRKFPTSHVVLLIDFDEKEGRKDRFDREIPEDVKSRVFVIGSKDEPEVLKSHLKLNFEAIGYELAEECATGDYKLWDHSHLDHNKEELKRLVTAVKPFLFSGS